MSIWNPVGGLSRRDLLKLSAAGVSAVSLSGWLKVLASRAADSRAKHKSCILLWMDGGPSHKDTFDLKPGTKNGGEFKPISTNVPGIQISEHFPKLARQMNHAAILRGMSTSEGAHGRAKYYMHTGYKEGQGGLTYPSLGSLVSSEIGRPNAAMPNYVAIGRSYGAGFLGARHAPLIVNDPARGVENLKPMVGDNHFHDRMGLLQEMESAFQPRLQGRRQHRSQDDLPAGRHAHAVQGGQGVRSVAGIVGVSDGLRLQPLRRRLPAGPPSRRSWRLLRRGNAASAGTRTRTISPASNGCRSRSIRRCRRW